VIHSARCGTLKRLDHARFIDASWKGMEEQLYMIHVELAIENRMGMFRDIANSFVQHDIVVDSFQTKEHPSRHMQSYLKTEQKTLYGDVRYVHIDFYLRRLNALSSLYADLENIQGVFGVCTTGS
jgi:(p)ppGpp synthase/HD superfamily hydrolase